MMRLVLVGAPASGKGTQAAALGDRLAIPTISTGDMFRAAVAQGSQLGQEAGSYLAAGRLVPDALAIRLVDERLQRSDTHAGFILDGFPRTVAQAQALEKLLGKRERPLHHVVYLAVPRELLTERATQRRTDKRTGHIYHLKYNPPPPDADLEHRADDREETVAQRLDEFEAMTAALLPYYEKRQLLTRIDGAGNPQAVTKRIFAALHINP